MSIYGFYAICDCNIFPRHFCCWLLLLYSLINRSTLYILIDAFNFTLKLKTDFIGTKSFFNGMLLKIIKYNTQFACVISLRAIYFRVPLCPTIIYAMDSIFWWTIDELVWDFYFVSQIDIKKSIILHWLFTRSHRSRLVFEWPSLLNKIKSEVDVG